MSEVIEAQVVPTTAPVPAPRQTGLQLAGDPSESLAMGRKAASALMDFAQAGGAVMQLQGKKYVKAEGWLFMARTFGLTVTVNDVEVVLENPMTFKATAHVLDASGNVVGAGIGFCGRDEKTWSNRPTYALASMAQTRATSKALRGLLSWVAVLAGCEGTPGEEISAPSQPVAPQQQYRPRPAPQYPKTSLRTPQPPSQQHTSTEPLTEAQKRAIYGVSKGKGIKPTDAVLKAIGRPVGQVEELSKQEAIQTMKWLNGEIPDHTPAHAADNPF